MSTQVPADEAVAAFVRRWESSAAAERANFQSFCNELCDVLAVPRPDPSRQDERDNAYVYDKAVQFDDGEGRQTTSWIDLYKRGCFIMEAKQGSTAEGPGGPNLFDLTAASRGKRNHGTARRGTAQWDAAMKKARGQAQGHVHALPPKIPSRVMNAPQAPSLNPAPLIHRPPRINRHATAGGSARAQGKPRSDQQLIR